MVYWGRIVESLQCLAEETGPYALRDHCRAWCWSVTGSQSQMHPAATQRIESLKGGEISGTDKRGDYDSYLKPSSLGAGNMV